MNSIYTYINLIKCQIKNEKKKEILKAYNRKEEEISFLSSSLN